MNESCFGVSPLKLTLKGRFELSELINPSARFVEPLLLQWLDRFFSSRTYTGGEDGVGG